MLNSHLAHGHEILSITKRKCSNGSLLFPCANSLMRSKDYDTGSCLISSPLIHRQETSELCIEQNAQITLTPIAIIWVVGLLNIQVLKCSHQYNSNKRWGILEMIRSWGPPMSLCLSLWQSICQNQYREGRIHFRSQLEDTDHHDSNRTHSQLWWKQRKASCSHLHRVETEKGQKASPDYNSQSAHPRVPFPPTVPCLLKITQTHHRVPPCGN